MVQNLEYSAITISSYFDQSIGQSIKHNEFEKKGTEMVALDNLKI